MPNIELHSFGQEMDKIKDAVWACLFHSEELREFADEVVVTTVPSVTDNRHGRGSPFVRVFFETNKEMKMCKGVLCRVPHIYKCYLDVEFVRVAHFCSFPPKTTV